MPRLEANLINRYRALREFALGETLLESTPPSLQIARSNLCNFKCVYCPDHRQGNDIPRTVLSGATWRSLLDLIPTSLTMAFHGVSEFMVDPEFFDIVERCARSRVHLSINTNGSVCARKHLDLFARYPAPLYVNFSVDAATPQTYARIRGWKFDRLLDNIRSYVACFQQRAHPTRTTLSYVIVASNVHEIVDFVRLAADLGVDGVKFYPLDEYDYIDWRVPTAYGGDFDYRAEMVSACPAEHDAAVSMAKQVAAEVGIVAELPAPFGSREAGLGP